MDPQVKLLAEIESFLAKRTGMAETTFGRLAVNDGKFVRRLRDGCNMTLATIARVQRFLKEYAPEDARAKPVAAAKPKRARATQAQDTTTTESQEKAA